MKQSITKGFIALSSVLILSAIFLSLCISLTFQAISSSQNSFALIESSKAEILAKNCVEYALKELQHTLNYQGNESILFGSDSCTINQIEGEGNSNRIIETEAIVSTYTHRFEVVVEEINPVTIIDSYRTITNF